MIVSLLSDMTKSVDCDFDILANTLICCGLGVGIFIRCSLERLGLTMSTILRNSESESWAFDVTFSSLVTFKRLMLMLGGSGSRSGNGSWRGSRDLSWSGSWLRCWGRGFGCRCCRCWFSLGSCGRSFLGCNRGHRLLGWLSRLGLCAESVGNKSISWHNVIFHLTSCMVSVLREVSITSVVILLI